MKRLLLLIPLLLTSCGGTNNQDFIDYVEICISYSFNDFYEDRQIITLHTEQEDIYYLTDLYWKYDFENDIYCQKYISAVDGNNELQIRMVAE